MSSSIKFTHSDSGNLESTGSTGLSLVTTIGALAHTSKLTRPEKGVIIKNYATDRAGLVDAIDKCKEANDFLQWSIQAVSVIITQVEDKGEIEGQLDAAMWLVAGLSELSSELNNVSSEMEVALEHQKQQT